MLARKVPNHASATQCACLETMTHVDCHLWLLMVVWSQRGFNPGLPTCHHSSMISCLTLPVSPHSRFASLVRALPHLSVPGLASVACL